MDTPGPELLLARPDGRAFLDQGLPWEATLATPRAAATPDPGPEFLGPDIDPNSPAKGWGVLHAPEDAALVPAIQALVAHRAAQIADAWVELSLPGPPPQPFVWSIPAGMTVDAFEAAEIDPLDRDRQPEYLLILGDLHRIPLAFQLGLARRARVGRLCLPGVDDYRAYARKLVALETGAPRGRGRLVLYGSSDPARPDRALQGGWDRALAPVAREAREGGQGFRIAPTDVHLHGPALARGAWQQVRGLVQEPRPTVLFSLTHGQGDAHWTAEQQQAEQGRVVLEDGQPLPFDQLTQGAFLDGGVWLQVACFGAATPDRSHFAPWLRRLVATGAVSERGLPDLLATQARAHPFVARQPQLALANPQGPVAVISHADIAFDTVYRGFEGGDPQAGPALLVQLLRVLVEGGRVGQAVSRLEEHRRRVDSRLLRAVQAGAEADEQVARLLIEHWEQTRGQAEGALGEVVQAVDAIVLERSRAGVTLDEVAGRLGWSPMRVVVELGRSLDEAAARRARQQGMDWLAHHDLAGWILLGDPAARLVCGDPQQQARDDDLLAQMFGAAPGAPPPDTDHAPPVDAHAGLEDAIAEYMVDVRMRGSSTGQQVARKHGLSLEELKAAHDRYVAAGRAALVGWKRDDD